MRASKPLLALVSDERLAEEIRRGNEAAFEVLYERHGAAVLSLCRHILGCPEEAEEALQHAFAAVWSYLQRGRPVPHRLQPWLFAVARNRCLSLLRARQPDPLELHEAPCTVGLADQVERRADLRELLSNLGELPEQQRTALLLSELGGLSHADIAAVLGRKEASVKALVFCARSTLIDWREARETPCEQFREQLSVLRGGALRRKTLRRHLQGCPGCRAFRYEVRRQRGMIALILPVAPSAWLKGSVLAAGVSGTATGGGAVGGGAAIGLGTATVVPFGGTAAATLVVVGVLATGQQTVTAKDEGKRPTPLAQSLAASPATQQSGVRHAATRILPRARGGAPRRDSAPSATAPRPGAPQPGASATPEPTGAPSFGAAPDHSGAPMPPAGATPAVGPGKPGASTPAPLARPQATAPPGHSGTAPGHSKADQKEANTTAKGDQNEANKTAKADQKQADKSAKADQKKANKLAEADQ